MNRLTVDPTIEDHLQFKQLPGGGWCLEPRQDFNKPLESIEFDVSRDESTTLTTGTNKYVSRVPYAFEVRDVRASLSTVSSSGAVTIDVNKNGTTIFSTTLTIDANEKTSTSAAAAHALTTTVVVFDDDDEISIDIDGAGTGATGLKVRIIGQRIEGD